MRSCLVRGICDSADNEEYVQVEKHLCDECRPDGWIIFNFVSGYEGVEELAGVNGVNIASGKARKLALATLQMCDELDAR